MPKKKVYIILIFIFILSFFAGNFVYPQLLNLPFVPEKDFKLGLDLQGGVHFIYQADLSAIEEGERDSAMQGLRDVIEKRVNLFGVAEPLVQVQGDRLIIELAGVVDPAKAIEEIGKTPFLEFREQKENYEEILERNQKILLEGAEGEAVEDPFRPTPLTGRYLEKAEVVFDPNTYQPMVSLQFNEEGAKIFEELTEKNVGKVLAIYIDQMPISMPLVQEKISGGRAQISGDFTVEEARELAQNLNAGALPVPITLISQQTIGPTLGQISLEQSLKAGIYGFLAILLFMILFYRIPGLFSSISLFIYVIFMLSLFKLISVTLTLAGIAGFVLSMGMAVDANILIFSRMREELKEGKTFSVSIEQGLKRAWPAIRDGNMTTILIGLILFTLGTGFVQGFGFTLFIGNLVGMFTSVFITVNILRCFDKEKSPKWLWLWR